MRPVTLHPRIFQFHSHALPGTILLAARPELYSNSPSHRRLQHQSKPRKLKSELKRAYPLLRDLPRTLILGVPQQFHYAALVRGKAGDFLDDAADERGAAGQAAFGAGDAGALLDGCGFLLFGKNQLLEPGFERGDCWHFAVNSCDPWGFSQKPLRRLSPQICTAKR